MRVLVVGSGGREHALAWRLSSSPTLTELHAAPGNPGIARLATCHPLAAGDGDGLRELARSLGADLVVVGPEAPLVAGVADTLRHAGISVYGPSAAAARIEGSKLFAKDVMAAAGVPTARLLDEPRAPCVLKANGLAAGKGVVVCRTDAELEAALGGEDALEGTMLVEELLDGPELSVLALCDGQEAIVLAPARDYKRAHDGDRGPNTGGMGSFAPAGAQVDVTSLGGNDLTFSGGGTQALIFSSVQYAGGLAIYSYTLPGALTAGTVTVTFNAGAWHDTDGNLSAGGSST